jgi:hypothetical protein
MNKLLVTLLVSTALSACGGAGVDVGAGAGGGAGVDVGAGGGGGGTGGTPTLREGLYTGSSLNFWDLTGSPSTVLALEGGEVWALQGRNPPVFFGQGTFAYTGTKPGVTTTTTQNTTPPTITTTSTPDIDIFSQSKALVTLNSNVLQEANMTVRYLEDSFGKALLAGTPTQPEWDQTTGREAIIERGFNYNKPASLQDVAGTWGSRNDRRSFVDTTDPKNRALTVAASGAISAPAQTSGCSLAGTITPRPSGKNVFTLRLTLAGCPSAGEYAGVAFNYMDGGYSGAGPFIIPTFRLIAINSDKTKMFAMTTAR